MNAPSNVTRIPAAEPDVALAHFRARLSFETDCWDVHEAIESGSGDFVLLDVRSEELYRRAHVPTAIHLPHWRISAETLPALANESTYVVYCAGPHCNGANKAAVAIASLGLPVKEMLGGVEGWKDEGFAFD